jgi:hypothetical protein
MQDDDRQMSLVSRTSSLALAAGPGSSPRPVQTYTQYRLLSKRPLRHPRAPGPSPGHGGFSPRFVQLAIWRYCSQQGLDVCNGNRLDDWHRCENRHCRLYGICDRIRLK